MIDKKALRILSSTYWSSTGWRDKYHTPPDDFKYAKSQGLMFDPITATTTKLWIAPSRSPLPRSHLTWRMHSSQV
jgi:hypothetical protein